MKAVRLHGYHQPPQVDDVPEPPSRGRSTSWCGSAAPASAGPTCTSSRGSGTAAMAPTLPYTIGHENAGWVHEVGSAVTNVAVGDTVILHPTPTCGLCRACRAGNDMHCANSTFPGLDADGGMAEYLLTSARACVKLDPTHPAQGRRRAGRRRHHRLPRGAQGGAAALSGHHRVVIGAGGLGHIGIQCLAALTATNIIVVDRNPDALGAGRPARRAPHRASPTASRSTRSRTSPAGAAPTSCSTSSPSRARRTRASR